MSVTILFNLITLKKNDLKFLDRIYVTLNKHLLFYDILVEDSYLMSHKEFNF